MSGIIHKVKDALRGDDNEAGPGAATEDSYGQSTGTTGSRVTGEGTHLASSGEEARGLQGTRGVAQDNYMPGGFDNSNKRHGISTGTDPARATESTYGTASGATGYGTTAGSTTQPHHHHHHHSHKTEDSGLASGTDYDRKEAAVTGRDPAGSTAATGGSQYTPGAPTSHHNNTQLYNGGRGGTSATDNRGVGHGTTTTAAAAGAGAAGLSSRGGDRRAVPDRDVMDPADSNDGANILNRGRDDYSTTASSTSGPHKLHKRDDPRGYEAGTTAGTTSGTAYGDDTSTSTGTGGPHSSKLLNKLDPRVDSSGISSDANRDTTSDYRSSERGVTNGSGLGAAGLGAAGATAATAGQRHGTSSREGYGDPSYASGTGTGGVSGRGRDEYSGTQAGRGTEAGYGTTSGTSRDNYSRTQPTNTSATTGGPSIPTRTHDNYGTTTSGGSDSRFASGAPYSNTGYGDTANTSSGTAGPHNSKLLNKLDPRVDSSQQTSSSDYPSTASGYQSTTGASNPISTSGVGQSTSNTAGSGRAAGRTHFHCMNCGHRNDASHLRDAKGQSVVGRYTLHCMDCGHQNNVESLFNHGTASSTTSNVGRGY